MGSDYSGQILLTLLCLMAVPSPGFSQGSVPDLSEMSLEDLMNIEVTSVSRKEQRAADVAAELLKTLSAEEHLWIDFNSSLAGIERALPTTREH